ncbi:hypothetical protein MASR2M15_17710 [Anaerolineales bacterium]
MWNKIQQALLSTSSINPDEYSAKTSPNRLHSFGYAVAGWVYMLKHQKNIRIIMVASILVLLFCLWLEISRIELAIIIVTITMVWLAEFINAAIEAAINLSTSQYHPMAQVGKDVAAGATLLCAIASILIGILVLLPSLLSRLHTIF